MIEIAIFIALLGNALVLIGLVGRYFEDRKRDQPQTSTND
jgi:hypothetical protein